MNKEHGKKMYIQEYNVKKYCYDFLIKQRDIEVINQTLIDYIGFSKQKILQESKNKALLSGSINDIGYSYSVFNKNEKVYIKVNQDGLFHHKRKRINNIGFNTIVNLSVILSNAIKLNEAYRMEHDLYKDIDVGAFLSIYYNIVFFDNEPYVVRILVKDNNLSKLESHKLYSAKTQKSGSLPGSFESVTSASTISVKELIEKVNCIDDSNYKDSLPLNVLYRLNGTKYRVRVCDIEGLKY